MGRPSGHALSLLHLCTSRPHLPTAVAGGKKGRRPRGLPRRRPLLHLAHPARHPGPAFDYVSVCPPYEAVSYTELMAALAAAAGRVLHAHSFVIVEYPRLATREMPARLGPLARLRDRKYGRTLVAIYGPE